MTYTPQDFSKLLGTKGFSDRLLQNHFKLYQGYVTNANKLLETFAAMSKEGNTGTPEFAELKRRFGWEFNGMRLHELYFGNMNNEKKTLPSNSPLIKKMAESFGSAEECEKAFVATGSMRGIGWVIMYYDPLSKKLMHTWINEHDVGHLAGCPPLLVMDAFEHAYMVDYDTNKAEYIKAFLAAIDWEVVEKRYNAALKR